MNLQRSHTIFLDITRSNGCCLLSGKWSSLSGTLKPYRACARRRQKIPLKIRDADDRVVKRRENVRNSSWNAELLPFLPGFLF